MIFDYLDNVHGETLWIPVGDKAIGMLPPANVEEGKIREFLAARIEGEYVTKREAQFYLDDNEWDVQAAVAKWRDDVEWERAEKAKAERKAALAAQPTVVVSRPAPEKIQMKQLQPTRIEVTVDKKNA